MNITTIYLGNEKKWVICCFSRGFYGCEPAKYHSVVILCFDPFSRFFPFLLCFSRSLRSVWSFFFISVLLLPLPVKLDCHYFETNYVFLFMTGWARDFFFLFFNVIYAGNVVFVQAGYISHPIQLLNRWYSTLRDHNSV